MSIPGKLFWRLPYTKSAVTGALLQKNHEKPLFRPLFTPPPSPCLKDFQVKELDRRRQPPSRPRWDDRGTVGAPGRAGLAENGRAWMLRTQVGGFRVAT